MKITRKQTWKMFNAGWCPNCAEQTQMREVVSCGDFPTNCCEKCGKHYMINILENKDEEVVCPDYLVIPSDEELDMMIEDKIKKTVKKMNDFLERTGSNLIATLNNDEGLEKGDIFPFSLPL